MKHKIIFFFIACLLLTGIAVNSCKKDNTTSIQTLFTTGTWQLASVKVTNYLGSSTVNTYYLNDTTCTKTQFFTFPSTNTCTFTNYHCIEQSTTGSWTLSKDQLFLMVNMTCLDTLAGGKGQVMTPVFANTRIVNLGPYSMTLQTGDIGAYYTSTTKRTIFEYAFVHRTTTK